MPTPGKGSYDDSISQTQLSLALARKTLDPLGEATSLNNIANAEMAKGRFDRAASIMCESAKIEADHPRWPLRLFRYYNRGVLRLLVGEVGVARSDLSFALEQAMEVNLWPIALYSCGALGLCALRENDLPTLSKRRGQLDAIARRQMHLLPERWTAEATVAWDTALNLGKPEQAIARATRTLKELRRRDVDSCLRLELEVIRLREYIDRRRRDADRASLAIRAAEHGALAVRRDAMCLATA